MQRSQSLFTLSVLTKLADVAVVVFVWWLTWYLRFSTDWFPLTRGIPAFEVYSSIALPLGLIFTAALHTSGAYKPDRLGFGFRATKKIVEGTVLGTLLLVAYLYFTELYRFSRIYLALFSCFCVFALILERLFLQWFWKAFEAKFFTRPRVLFIGYGELLNFYFQELVSLIDSPIEWIGRLGPQSSQNEIPQMSYLGTESKALEMVRNHRVDKVVISYPSTDPGSYEPLLNTLSNEMATLTLIPDFGKFSTFTYRAGEDHGIPVLDFNIPPIGNTDRAIKRFIDLLGSTLFLIVFSPLFLVLGVLVKLSSPGPIFYSQKRMGADGTVFSMFKFRTMRVDAEAHTGAVWAVENDERTTPLGSFLRKTSLDEIPQFFNVLRGDMSLVGPRPERPFFVEQFRDQVPKYMLRHKVRSGITGWAQINGWRGNTSIEERINHDLFYIRHWSLLLDIKILILTLFRGFVHPNAY